MLRIVLSINSSSCLFKKQSQRNLYMTKIFCRKLDVQLQGTLLLFHMQYRNVAKVKSTIYLEFNKLFFVKNLYFFHDMQ